MSKPREPKREITLTESQIDILGELILPIDETVTIRQPKPNGDILFTPSHDPEQVVVVPPTGLWYIQKRRTPSPPFDPDTYIEDKE